MKNSVDRIIELFRGSNTYYGTHGEPELDENGVKWGIKKTARTLKGKTTPEMWKAHLDGKKPLGVITIMDDSKCVWGSIDVDQYDVDAIEVIKRIDAAKLPLVPCRSKSGGLHLFMFASEPVDAEKMQTVLREIAAVLGFAGSEIFPKQTKVFIDKGEQGNWMVMPYYGGDYGGKLRFQYGLKKSGAEMTLEEFCSFAEKRRITESGMTDLRSELAKPSVKKNSKVKEKEPFHDGPPCLQFMARNGGFPEGNRNNALFHLGVYLRKAFPDDWQKHLEDDNYRLMKPPLPIEEVRSVVRSLEKKDYEYKCRDQPMVSHCDSVKCRSRKFGVGDGGAYPKITAITVLLTDPPLWFVEVPGGHIMARTHELTNYRKFHNLCMEQSQICFTLMNDKVWNSIIAEAMANATRIEAPPEGKRGGIFNDMMSTFLTNRTVGEKKEDLLRGVPWLDDETTPNRYVFSLSAVLQFLKRENIKDFDRNEVIHRLGEVPEKSGFGATKLLLDVKGKRNQRYWTIAVDKVEKVSELDPPNEEKEII